MTNGTIFNSECSIQIKNDADVDFVSMVAKGFFRGKQGSPKVMEAVTHIDPANMDRFEQVMKAIAPFMVDGGEVVFHDHEVDVTKPIKTMPFVRWIVQGGRMNKEFAKVAWEGNKGR